MRQYVKRKINRLIEKGGFVDLKEFHSWRKANKRAGIPVIALRPHVRLSKKEWSYLVRHKRR